MDAAFFEARFPSQNIPLGIIIYPMPKKNAAAVQLGRKGGKARAKKLTAKQLSKIGRDAARARWGKRKNENKQTKASEVRQ